jgi:hypothetical protein
MEVYEVALFVFVERQCPLLETKKKVRLLSPSLKPHGVVTDSSTRDYQPSEPRFLANLQRHFADFPYLHAFRGPVPANLAALRRQATRYRVVGLSWAPPWPSPVTGLAFEVLWVTWVAHHVSVTSDAGLP